MKPATVEQFQKYANFFFKSIGIRSYASKAANASPITWLFFVLMPNISMNALCMIAYVADAAIHKRNFETAIMTMSHLCFGTVGLYKMIYIFAKRKQMATTVRKLDEIFPKTLEKQVEYELPKYLKSCTQISFAFSMVYMCDIWIYNLYDFLNYHIANRLLHLTNAEKQLPYYMVIPWNYIDNWSFYVVYCANCISGYTSAAGQIASDLLLFSTATQVLMHYDFISRTIEKYVVKNDQTKGRGKKEAGKEDIKFLGEMVEYHEKIFRLSDLMNEVFGVPIFLNFFSTALVFCTLAFQALTIGIPRDQYMRVPFFLASTVMQIYFISYYGQEIMDASQNIAAAVYNQNWSYAEIRYQKMLVVIAQRAQRPAILKATTLMNLSRGTMTDVMSLSYQLFTVLRTMYSD